MSLHSVIILYLEMARIDLVDDLKVPWEEFFQNAHGPSLQGLREQGMVGVGKCVGANGPGIVPTTFLKVHQDPHQLRHCQSRVCVIELYGCLQTGTHTHTHTHTQY